MKPIKKIMFGVYDLTACLFGLNEPAGVVRTKVAECLR